MSLESKIEAVLFWKGEAMDVQELATALDSDADAIESALKTLENSLREHARGITVVRNGNEVMLYTSAENSDLIKKLAKGELTKEISKAALEVLSLIIYRGPISKKEIDYVRGVNSSFIIRNLLIRGLIEKTNSDVRSFSYGPSMELLAFLGVNKREDVPGFETVVRDIQAFMSSEISESGAEKENQANG